MFIDKLGNGDVKAIAWKYSSDKYSIVCFFIILVNISMINCVIYSSALTWTGSVPLEAGSEDPPPNKVEIVFPSSERQHSVGSVIHSNTECCVTTC